MIANQTITHIAWDALRSTPDEAVAMVAGGSLSAELARAMHRASDGWAAGLVLMREHLGRDGGAVPDTLLPEGKEAVFDYFTGEIFARAKPNNQRTLMLAALLPSVTASDAEAITGDADAPRVLDYLYRHHLFTDRRRTGAAPIYQFHGLFREFLLAEGQRRLPAAERRVAMDRAGNQLAARGDFDAAARQAPARRGLSRLRGKRRPAAC